MTSRHEVVEGIAGHSSELARACVAEYGEPRIATARDDEVFAAVVVDVDPTHARTGCAELHGERGLAGEIVDDPSALAAAIRYLPWVNEIADRIETAWVLHPESDPTEWIASLSEEERQILLDRLRSFRWSQS